MKRILLFTVGIRPLALMIALLWLNAAAFAQQFGWERAYELNPVTFSSFQKVIQAQDGGFCALAPGDYDTTRIYLVKTAADGEKIWESVYFPVDKMTSSGLLQVADGGYIVPRSTPLGENYANQPNAALHKFDAAGQHLWQKNYIFNKANQLYSVHERSDGALFGAGATVVTPGSNDGLLLYTDASGNLLDTIIYHVANEQVIFKSVHFKPNGEILVAGAYTKPSNFGNKVLWLRYDNNLNLLESKLIDTIGFYGPDIRFAADGALFTAGHTNPQFLSVMKLDADGNLVWLIKQSLLDWNSDLYPYQSRVAPDQSGGCFVSSGEVLQVIARFSDQGSEQWHRIVGLANTGIKLIRDLAATADDGVIGAGHFYSILGAYLIKLGPGGQLYANKIKGRLVSDQNDNCTAEPTEPGLKNRTIVAEGTTFTYYGLTDSSGAYQIEVPPGTYTLNAEAAFFQAVCQQNIPVVMLNTGDSVTVDFTDTLPLCPLLDVSLSTFRIRVCQTGHYWGAVQNWGNAVAQGAYVEIELDSFLQLTETIPPFTSQNGQTVRIDLGDIQPGQSRLFQVKFSTDCNAPLGYSHCSEAHVYPDSICFPIDSLWNRASLRIDGSCNNGNVRFVVTNIGTGAMTNMGDFIVIEDEMIQKQGNIPPLNPGETYVEELAADGSIYRMVVQQPDYHPFNTLASAAVQGCNGFSFNLNPVNWFPLGDSDPWTDVHCITNTFPYDPNMKVATPEGYGPLHLIEPGTELEYVLHFQNTGTDTAFNVVLRDTLSDQFDIASVRPGASSHPYTWEIDGTGVLIFRFRQIMLPDSNVNEPASHGYVHFAVRHRDGLPLGSVIRNDVAIYFDFNAPVITNETWHTLGVNFLSVSTTPSPQQPQARLSVMPNPVGDQAVIDLQDAPEDTYTLSVLDLNGRLVYNQVFSGQQCIIQKGDLPSGLYLLRVSAASGWMMNGKMTVR